MPRRLRLIRAVRIATNADETKERAGTVKIAFATEDLKRVDAHFGWAKNIAVYELSDEECKLVKVFQFEGDLKEDGNENKLTPKVEAVMDCAILYVASIGASAAARIVQKGIHPIKVNQPEEIADLLAKLQAVLKGNPPPWLRKALLKGKEREFDFDEEDEGAHA
ncbi:MAG TPA: nitrogen fixation protein NifX [Geobacterales bacterium]|nr:nitrogen fixation protein NifX [Geobacterales bacterium]